MAADGPFSTRMFTRQIETREQLAPPYCPKCEAQSGLQAPPSTVMATKFFRLIASIGVIRTLKCISVSPLADQRLLARSVFDLPIKRYCFLLLS
jgi:hypothetical protein